MVDACENRGRTKICVAYIISAVLIGAFVGTIVYGSTQTKRQLEQLKRDVEELGQAVLANGATDSSTGQPKQLEAIVDVMVKKRVAGLWDDIYSVKKQLNDNSACAERKKRAGTEVGTPYEERINFASEELGAKILKVVAEPVNGKNFLKSLLSLEFSANPPINMLRQSMDPGSCFGFKNNKSEVTVKLAKPIFIESIELEHISAALSPTSSTGSAPRAFSVYGVDLINCNVEQLFGYFEYKNSPQQRVQLFPVKVIEPFGALRFKFETNHGDPQYTCIYRIAVFGKMDKPEQEPE